ncbi:anaerobic ribonucleoside-triphosphate reductase activating protein [Konateibacter massiliensis]|uniref:anaerobic ribonucleoside-triphosphate reductase activating protein n=1 Tax=Konateibacter massiliensis TaxID=2002841 RepID=UPI000C14A9CB|nr:anaerobic ribonucleoside-triphosphate reductase activating protein [Konateibacter massiliensis]
MQIHGFNKTTLLDYPGHLACTIFLGNCNFRCPFCHNKGLVLAPDNEPLIPTEYVLSYLAKRKNILEGVCITGGEPTLSSDLEYFIRQIKEIGLLVKLDTNGYRPNVLRKLTDEGLLDYIAMDIKSSPQHYALLAGLETIDMNKIEESIHIIRNTAISYEFRTTLVKELHSLKDIEAIGQWLKGCDQLYLQNYRENEHVINPIYSGFSKDELLVFQEYLSRYIKQVQIRGID